MLAWKNGGKRANCLQTRPPTRHYKIQKPILDIKIQLVSIKLIVSINESLASFHATNSHSILTHPIWKSDRIFDHLRLCTYNYVARLCNCIDLLMEKWMSFLLERSNQKDNGPMIIDLSGISYES